MKILIVKHLLIYLLKCYYFLKFVKTKNIFMNYILISKGIIPDHINYTINTILSVDKNAEIYFCSDVKANFKNVNFIHMDDIVSNNTQEIASLQIYKNTIFEKNPLWETSMLRIFYLNDIQTQLNLNQLVHFDNDILIYKPYDAIAKVFNEEKFFITPSNLNRMIFGYSFIPNNKIYKQVCNSIHKKLIEGVKNEWGFNKNTPPNEMDLLGMVNLENPELFKTLPIFPYYSNILFDPLGYGQYIDGTHTNPKKTFGKDFLDFNDSIAVEIFSKRISCRFSNSTPIISYKNTEFTLSNLHIHSKRFKKFLPKEYREYC